MSTNPRTNQGSPQQPGAGTPAVDPAYSSLAGAMRASFRVLQLLMIILVFAYLGDGVFRIEEGSYGLVARFGKLRTAKTTEGDSNVFPPGWHMTLPRPFDEKITIDTRVRDFDLLTFLFKVSPGEVRSKSLEELSAPRTMMQLDPTQDGALFTGDQNLSHGVWEVQYQITDPERFVTNVASSLEGGDRLLIRLTESAVMREVAGRTVEEVTRRAVEAVADGVRRRLQAQLDELATGVHVVKVVARTIEPPQVREAFLNVTRAEQEAEQAKQRAREGANATLRTAAGDQAEALIALIREYGDAQSQRAAPEVLEEKRAAIHAALLLAQERQAGRVAQVLNEAQQHANASVQAARREVEEVQAISALVAQNPSVALLDLWNRTRSAILENRRVEVFHIPTHAAIEVLIPSSEARKRELREELLQARRPG